MNWKKKVSSNELNSKQSLKIPMLLKTSGFANNSYDNKGLQTKKLGEMA